jgi:hypothetical protein
VKDVKNLKLTALYPVRDDVWVIQEYQFSGSRNSSGATEFWVMHQLFNASKGMLKKPTSGLRVILRYEVMG